MVTRFGVDVSKVFTNQFLEHERRRTESTAAGHARASRLSVHKE
jgi:hypothetical protein